MVSCLNLGDVISFRKPHPCGGTKWEVYRIGADIGVQCLNCGRRIMMPRSALAKRINADLTPKCNYSS